MKTKYKLYFIVVLFAAITLTIIGRSYALFESNLTASADMPIGNWVIKLNDESITNGTTTNLVLDQFTYNTTVNVADGYIAPGTDAYCDIILDPSGSDVSVRYDLTFNIDDLDYADNISFNVSSVGDFASVKTGESTYSGVIDLESIENSTAASIRVGIVWDNDSIYDDTDTLLGMQQNSKISVPISVSVIQYLGEELVAYEEPSEGGEESLPEE